MPQLLQTTAGKPTLTASYCVVHVILLSVNSVFFRQIKGSVDMKASRMGVSLA